MGVEVGHWHYSNTSYSWDKPVPATVPYTYEMVGPVFSTLRLIMGIVIIFVWREVAKTLLLKYLPPLFRLIGRIGLSLPRKHFMDAREYKSVPPHLPDETIPPIGQLPRMIRRGRSDSVGPQSAADAYETLAFRERKRRESLGQDGAPGSPIKVQQEDFLSSGSATSSILPTSSRGSGTSRDEENMSSEPYEQQEREMLSLIEKPRVRYDVEVVTKLLVYGGGI
ncbi:hypothetical protein ABW19_dt0200767 [Dactylella cylindrospora]|nr:hypothetical protein ABW19_dt0200767 [Dactylella cylindrospora]